MADVLSFPFAGQLIDIVTEDGAEVTVRRNREPSDGALVSCYYKGLWLVAYLYRVGPDLIRLMDDSGQTRLFQRETLEIEGEVVNRPALPLPLLIRHPTDRQLIIRQR